MQEFFEIAVRGVEVAGVLLLIVGLIFFLGRFLLHLIRRPDQAAAYVAFRRGMGRTLLLSLEFLVAADIIYTVAVEQTFQSLGMLGILVLIRVFLSFALEVEVNGRWPWQGDGKVSGTE